MAVMGIAEEAAGELCEVVAHGGRVLGQSRREWREGEL